MSLLLLVLCLSFLSDEVDSIKDEYRFNGYAFQWSRGLYLSIDEPVSFLIYPGSDLEGVLCGVGGDAVLDLHLELIRGNVIIIDENPDDLPVLQFTTGQEPMACSVEITVREILYGATAESVYVFFAMRPVVEEMDFTVPVEPDSAITGE